MSSLLRSTKFVRYFTGAARTLILNAAKTTETPSLINPKTLCVANNVLMRDYATSKKTEQLEPLLQKLDSEVRRFGRISKRDIDEVFDEIRSKHDITSSQSLLVIRCCGELVPEELPEQRTLLVQKIWNVLTERGIPMDISHYNALLRVYIENEHPFSPAKFLEELENKGLQPNRVTYQRLMWRYCQDGDVEGATKVLERMRELNLPVSEPVLNALVMGHAFHGDTDGAKAVLQTMAAAGLRPSNRTYTLLACGYARQGDMDGVNATIKNATDEDAYMTDKDILDIIEHLAIGGHGDKAEQLFRHIQKSVGYNQDVCNLILRLLNKGQVETAKAVMKTMPKSTNIDDTIFKGAFFVKQLLKISNDSDAVIQTCKELKEENLVPNVFYIATECALQLGQAIRAVERAVLLPVTGAAPLLVPYLAEAGHICPTTHNPADFVLETLLGESEAPAQLSELCQNGKLCRKLDRMTARGGRIPVLHSDESIQRIFVEHVAKEQTQKMEFPTTFLTQFWILTRRMFLQTRRNSISLWIQLAHHVVSALLLGSIFFLVGNDANTPIVNFKFCLSCVVFFMYTYIMIPVLLFPTEVRLLRREYFNRYYSLKAYYAALTFSGFPVMLILGLVFLIICYLMSGQLLEWDRFMLFAVSGILTAICSEGLGLAVGSAFSVTNGSIMGPAIAAPLLALCCYGMGFGPYIESSMKFLMSASYLRYGLSGFSLALYQNRPVMECNADFCLYADPKLILRDVGMSNENYVIQVIGLLVFTTIHRLIAYFALRYRLTTEFSNKFMTYVSKFLKHR